MLAPKTDNSAFTSETLAAVEYLTEQGWQVPFVLRVDSLSNFQHTYANEDELIVEDLVANASELTPAQLIEKRDIALAEPLLSKQLITPDGRVTAVNVVLQYPELSLGEVPEAVAYGRAVQADMIEKFPHLNVYLTGTSMLNTAFFRSQHQ